MRLISTTLSGNNQEIIADALRSVLSFVDQCLLIDTGITDSTIDIAREIAGEKLVVVSYVWKNDFSDARNFALSEAHRLGADWSITVDTDERIVTNGEDIRGFLATAPEPMVLMEYADGHYRKERAFRLPAVGAYGGPTHEAFMGHNCRPGVFKRAHFVELGKSAEALKRKFARDIEILSKHTKEHPNDPRWWFYLGESFKNSNRLEEGIKAYKKCYELNGWDEEAAWSCYKAAECLVILSRFQEAVDTCMLGIARHPAFAELFWLAAFANYRMGRYQKAIWMAQLSARIGWTDDGIGKTANRVGFKHIPGCWEGPYDIMHWAHKQLGNQELSDLFKSKCDSLYAERNSASQR